MSGKNLILNVEFSKPALKELRKLPEDIAQRICDAIVRLSRREPNLDIKRIIRSNDKTNRLRVGRYRVIFKETIDTIVILSIALRQEDTYS